MARSPFDLPLYARSSVARRVRQTAGWACCVAIAGVLAPAAHAQQEAGGPIVIPGPGEKNAADLAAMASMATATPAAVVAASERPNGNANARTWGTTNAAPSAAPGGNDRFAALAGASGAIVIPGPGEAAVAEASAPTRRIAATPANPVAAGAEIDSLASRGEPPEFGPNAKPANPGRSSNQAASSPAINPGRSSPQAASASAINQAAASPQAREATRMAATPQSAQAAQSAQFQTARASLAAQHAQNTMAVRTVQVGDAVQSAPQVPSAQAAQGAQLAQVTQPAQPAQPVPAGQQDGETIRAAALAFLKQQVTGLPGQVEVTVMPAFPRGLAACATMQPFIPAGARLWGRTTVAVHCLGEHPWTVWLQAKVTVHATYYVAANTIAPGQMLSEADLVARDGDLTMLPQSIITAPSQAVGAVTLMRVTAGLPLRQDMLKNAASITAGQTVRVVAKGDGFSISAQGSALGSATPGQPVRVKTDAGQIIMGIVKDGSTVEIQM